MTGRVWLGRALAAVGALALFSIVGAGFPLAAQVVRAPRYTGAPEAPAPQLNLPPLPPAITPHGTVVEDVVVRVNDQIISRSDVERSEEQLSQDAREHNAPPSEVAQQQKDMLRDMIDQQLLLSKAKDLGLNADADVIRQLDEIRKQNKMASMDELERAAKAQGVSFEDFKAKIRNQVLTQQVVRDEVGRRLQLTPSEETAYYQAHKSEFEQPEQIGLSEILVPLSENATPAEIVQAEHKANELKTRVMQGADFAELAKKMSGGPSAAQGGELGMYKRGALAKVLEDQTYALKVGETTQPIRTRQGFVILKVTAHQAAGAPPMKEVEPQIQEALYMQAMQPALRAYLTKLREQAYVDIQPGFVDSGASTKESKPVFSAYTPPPVKKKTVKAKGRFDGNGRYTAVAAKKDIVSGPDTTGGRTLTGSEAKSAVDPSTGLAALSAQPKPGRRVRREKVRFGQAPRNSLPAGSDEVAVGSDTGPVTLPGQTSATPVAASAARGAAPGAVMASEGNTLGGISQESTSTSASADLADNPLTARAPAAGKTRFAAKSAEVKEKKVAQVTAKQTEKIKATPTAETVPEKEADQVNGAPLGLAGDTAKKPKKPRRVKGAPKERLEEKKKDTTAPAAVDPTANPMLAPTSDTPPSRKAPTTTPGTVPAPAAAPASGTTPGSGIPPATNTNPATGILPPAV